MKGKESADPGTMVLSVMTEADLTGSAVSVANRSTAPCLNWIDDR